MYSFKFYYLEACGNLKIKPNEKILNRIEDCTNTTSLNLSSIELNDDTCKVIGLALRKDVFLQELDLSSCILNDDGLSSLLSGLESNKFLLSLNLKCNNIRGGGAVVIGKFLRHNKHLQNLYLEWNATGIFPENFFYLCEGLCVNTSLKSLDLRNNQLNHVCAQSISEVINRNSTLENLDLRWNSIGLIGGRAILKSLSRNQNILKLDLTGNDVPLEIIKSIELLTSVSAERYVKNRENMKKTKFYASKFQEIQEDHEKELRTCIEEIERKDQELDSSQKWNSAKLSQLQETLIGKDKVIEDLVRKTQELQKKFARITEEKNDIALSLNELEIKNKELKKDYQLLLDKERKEKENAERKFIEEIGTTKEENMYLKKKVEDLKLAQKCLEDEVIKLKNTITKMEKMLKLKEESFEEQLSTLKEKHQEHLKEIDLLRKNEIAGIKEEFSEIEKNLKQRITHLESRRTDLERQIIEKETLNMMIQAETEKKMDELRKKMKDEEEILRKQMEERIALLESANKKQEELLKEYLENMYEIKKLCTENDLLLSEEVHRTQHLQHMLDTKDAEMNASIAKVKLEVKEQLEEFNQLKIELEQQVTENDILKQKIEDTAKKKDEEIKRKEEEIANLKREVERQKSQVQDILQSQNKRTSDLQKALALYINSVKTVIDNGDESGDTLNIDT